MNKLVVIHAGAIGDFILSLSLVQAVAERLRPRSVVAIASAPSAALAAGRSVIDERRSPDDIGLHTLFAAGGNLDQRLQSELPDNFLILNLLSGQTGPVHARLQAVTGGQIVSIDPRPSEATLRQRRHITDQWRDAAMRSGLEIGELLPPVIRMSAAHPDTDPVRPRVVIHPGSGGLAKCWPIERFFALADRLGGASVLWMLGPVEAENSGAVWQAVERRCAAHGENLLVEDDLIRAAGHLAGVDLYLGNDAGMSHVAAAIGVPTVVIYGPTDPAVWRSLGDHVAVVAPRQPGQPIDVVSLEAVSAIVRTHLAKSRGASG